MNRRGASFDMARRLGARKLGDSESVPTPAESGPITTQDKTPIVTQGGAVLETQ